MASRLAPTGRTTPDVLRVVADAVNELPQACVSGLDVRAAIRAAGNYAEADAAYSKALEVLGESGEWLASWSGTRSRVEAVALLRTAADAVEGGDTTDLPAQQADSIAVGAQIMADLAAQHLLSIPSQEGEEK